MDKINYRTLRKVKLCYTQKIEDPLGGHCTIEKTQWHHAHIQHINGSNRLKVTLRKPEQPCFSHIEHSGHRYRVQCSTRSLYSNAHFTYECEKVGR